MSGILRMYSLGLGLNFANVEVFYRTIIVQSIVAIFVVRLRGWLYPLHAGNLPKDGLLKFDLIGYCKVLHEPKETYPSLQCAIV